MVYLPQLVTDMHPEDIALAKQIIAMNTVKTRNGPALNGVCSLLRDAIEAVELKDSALRAIQQCSTKAQAVRIANQALGEGEEG